MVLLENGGEHHPLLRAYHEARILFHLRRHLHRTRWWIVNHPINKEGLKGRCASKAVLVEDKIYETGISVEC